MESSMRSTEHAERLSYLQSLRAADKVHQEKEELLAQSKREEQEYNTEAAKHKSEAAKYESLFMKAQFFTFCKEHNIDPNVFEQQNVNNNS
jgi:hypothetical protein